MLLLHGAAGKGKSAVVHFAAKVLQSSNMAMTPFFAFNRSVLDRSASQLIPTWARHLAQLNPEYLKYLRRLSPQQVESSDILDQRDALLVGWLDSGIVNGKPLIFFIDALDECPPGESRALFRMLRELLLRDDLPCFIHFFFTYRSGENIQRIFNSLPEHDRLSIPIDDEEGTKEDILKFIKFQLDDTDVMDMIDIVAEAAQTLFECAAVLCRELTGKYLLSRSARAKFVKQLKDTPGMSLYQSYITILRMYINEDDAELMEQFRRIMAWILLVRSPQPRQVFRVFATAYITDESDETNPIEDKILSFLGSLFSGTVLESNKPVSPLHTSYRDFLMDSDASGKFSIKVDLHSHEAELAFACLKVMNSGLTFNICNLPTSFTRYYQIPDLHQRVERYIPPALYYTCLATAYHLRSSAATSISDVQTNATWSGLNIVEECKIFLEQKFLYWLEAHSCMQTEQDGPGTVLPVFSAWASVRISKT